MSYSKKLLEVINKKKFKHPYVFSNKRLNKMFNGINKKDYVVITGLPSTGKRSFVDHFYVIDLLNQWYNKDEEARELEPLRILYFSSKYPESTKMLKWASNLYTTSTGRIMDIPTMVGDSGKLFKINGNREEFVLKSFKVFEDAVKENVFEVVDSNITPLSIERKLNKLMLSMGEINYLENGGIKFIPAEEFEKALTVVVIDDIDNIKGSESNFGEGKMGEKEILDEMDSILTKYSSMGLTVVAIKSTEVVIGYKQYSPSLKEFKGLSPTKSIAIFNPFQEKYSTHLQFDTLEYIDKYNINRLRFAYISYNESGMSNVHLPLLFMPENGIFKELDFINNDVDESKNKEKFNKFVKIREKF